jgi:TRAP-type C4-dicarboxylate transport system permease small subunit
VESINKLLAILQKFNNATCAVGKQLGWWLIAIMTLIILIQVFFRYVLNAAPSWSEEVARSMMVWMTFAVAPIAYRTGGNVALDTLYFMLKGRLRTLMALLINTMIVIFIVVFFFESLEFVQRGTFVKATTVPIQMVYVYAILPVGLFAMFAVGVELLLKCLLQLIDPSAGDPEEIEPDHSHSDKIPLTD